jgi:hypothetical protein
VVSQKNRQAGNYGFLVFHQFFLLYHSVLYRFAMAIFFIYMYNCKFDGQLNAIFCSSCLCGVGVESNWGLEFLFFSSIHFISNKMSIFFVQVSFFSKQLCVVFYILHFVHFVLKEYQLSVYDGLRKIHY